MLWEIEPFIGLGPLKFGMSTKDVSQLNHQIGQVTATHPAFDGSINEYRGEHSPVCNYVEGRLNSIDTDRHCKSILFKGIDIYKSNPIDVIKLLQTENGGAKIGLGSVLFENIGINTGGFIISKKNGTYEIYDFKNHDQDERSLSIFSEGAFDQLKDRFQPIQF